MADETYTIFWNEAGHEHVKSRKMDPDIVFSRERDMMDWLIRNLDCYALNGFVYLFDSDPGSRNEMGIVVVHLPLKEKK